MYVNYHLSDYLLFGDAAKFAAHNMMTGIHRYPQISLVIILLFCLSLLHLLSAPPNIEPNIKIFNPYVVNV